MAAKKYDWVSLEVEFRTGETESLTDFFKRHEIPQSTWGPKSKGWLDNRKEHLKKVAEATAKKAITRRSTQIANMIEDSDELRLLVKDAMKKGLRVSTARDAATVLKMAHEINVEALGLEDPMSRIEGLLGASVSVTTGEGAESVKTEIKLIARDIARGRISGLGAGRALLGAGEHPHGEQQAV